MPLIIITGLPCSGKTHRAHQLAAEFTSRISTDPSSCRLRVQHLQSHHASADEPGKGQTSLRDQIYNSVKEEKTARAEEFSAVKRALSKDVVVIADGLNYIKGYRYQLWCEAKAAGTRCCVLHVAAREDECKAWNNGRLKAAGREDEVDEEQPDGATQAHNRTGQMLPESHTAIYGDRIIVPASRSRSSSMDGASDEDERPRPEDTMTLKSLYLRDRPGEKDDEDEYRSNLGPEKHENNSPAPIQETPLPTILLPPPSSSPPYTPSTLTSLCMRHEPPSPFSRWDTPLFTLPTTDTHPPYTLIWESLFPSPVKHLSKRALSQQSHGVPPLRPPETAVKQHAATILPEASSSSALQTLESSTQLVTTSVLAAYRAASLEGADGGDGRTLTFSVDGLECQIHVPPGLVLSQPMLQRLRRKYTGLQRGGIAHGVGSVQGGRRGVVEGFVGFLGREWGGSE